MSFFFFFLLTKAPNNEKSAVSLIRCAIFGGLILVGRKFVIKILVYLVSCIIMQFYFCWNLVMLIIIFYLVQIFGKLISPNVIYLPRVCTP